MTPAGSGVKREALSVKRYCNVAIPHTRLDKLTYEFEPEGFPELGSGACVQVRLRGRKAKGLVLEVLGRSPVPKTLKIEKLVEPQLVGEELLRLLRWVGAYYFGRMGEVLGLALPRGICGYGLRRGARADEVRSQKPETRKQRFWKGDEGRRAGPDTVCDAGRSPFVFGTSFAVYVDTGVDSRENVVAGFVAAGLERGAVIALMPESETRRWAAALRSRLGVEPVSYHGDLKASDRKRLWRELRSSERRLVLGVRSAVFAPVPDLAGFVVLDEHDRVFKEERHPRFNARDAAIARARLADCPLLLSDPIPSAETWLNLCTGQYRWVEDLSVVPRPSPGDEGSGPRVLPDTIVVDMTKHRNDMLSPLLANELKDAYSAGDSAVLYINRRGLSRYVACRDCGTPLSCPDCAVSFVLFAGGMLSCRYCGKAVTAPETCPACGSPDFRLKAPGIEMAAREVSRLLPGAKVVTVLAESVHGPSSIVHRSVPEPGTVTIGTRAVIGIPWPDGVRVVAVLSVDDDLCLPDFRARERAFQVLSELSRRAAVQGATLVLQTRRPDDPAVHCAVAGDVSGFLDRELKLRQETEFPPYRRLALVELSAASASRAAARAEWLNRRLGRSPGVEVLGPVPVRGKASAVQVMVKVARNLRLDRLVSMRQLEADGVRARVDVDPLETA